MKSFINITFVLSVIIFSSCGKDGAEPVSDSCKDEVPRWKIKFNNPTASAVIENGKLKIKIPEPLGKNDVVLSVAQQNSHPPAPNLGYRTFAIEYLAELINFQFSATNRSHESYYIKTNLAYSTVPDSSLISIETTATGATVRYSGHFNSRGSVPGRSGNHISTVKLGINGTDISYLANNVANPTGLKFPKITLPDPYLVTINFGVFPQAGKQKQKNLEFHLDQIHFSDILDKVQVREFPDDNFNCNSINQ